MIIADTSIWIEYFKANKGISNQFVNFIKENNLLALECVFAELLQGSKSRRETKLINSFWENLPKIDESGLWIQAGTLSAKSKFFTKGISLIDAFIISAARATKSKIWTLDKKMKSELTQREIFES